MIDNSPCLAILAGAGELVTKYIILCKKKKINFILIAIEGYYVDKKNKPNYTIKLDYIGKIFDIMKSNNISKIVFLGKIDKPVLYKLRPDRVTFYYLLILLFFYYKGDDRLLTKIYNIFTNKGYKVLDPRKLLYKNITNNKYNNLKKFKDKINKKQIKKYYDLSKDFGLKDLGQSIIVGKQKILLEEDKKGTDNLIYRYKKLKNKNNFDLLVKSSKPKQNLFIDIPTIGPNTIINIYKANIKGIIIESRKTFIINPKKTFLLISKYKLFFYAI